MTIIVLQTGTHSVEKTVARESWVAERLSVVLHAGEKPGKSSYAMIVTIQDDDAA